MCCTVNVNEQECGKTEREEKGERQRGIFRGNKRCHRKNTKDLRFQFGPQRDPAELADFKRVRGCVTAKCSGSLFGLGLYMGAGVGNGLVIIHDLPRSNSRLKEKE